MKSISLLILSIAVASAFPGSMLFSQLKRQAVTTQPPMNTMAPTQPASNGRSVEANTCRCFKAVSEDLLACLPTGGAQPMAFSNELFCYCYDETIELPDTCIIPTSPANVSEVCDLFWTLQYFQVMTFESLNVSQFASIEGRVASGGSVWLNNFKLNFAPSGVDGLASANSTETITDTDCAELDEYDNSWKFAVVAKNNLSLTNGKVYSGDIVYGGEYLENNFNLSNNCQSIMNSTILDFVFAKSEIARISNGLYSMPANGQYAISSGVLRLTAPSQINANQLLVWNINLVDLININSIQFIGFPDQPSSIKALVFNLITPNGVQIPSGFNFDLPISWNFEPLANNGYANKIIFNFGSLEATMRVSSSAPDQIRTFFGTILAPSISLDAGSTRLRIVGSAFLNSYSGDYLWAEAAPTQYCLQTILDSDGSQTTTSAPVSTTSIPSRR